MKQSPLPEFEQLMVMLVDGELSVEQRHRLGELLRTDARARAAYHQYLLVHAGLAWECAAPEALPAVLRLPPARPGFGWRGRVAALAAVLLVAVLAGILFVAFRGGNADGAVVVSDIAAVWSPGGGPDQSRLHRGADAELLAGLAKLDFDGGATVVIEGPANFTIESGNTVKLASGKLTALVPPSAAGFTVRTAVADVVDLGTEFGVDVSGGSAAPAAAVYVFQGRVSIKPSAEAAVAKELSGGSGSKVGSAGRHTPAPPGIAQTFVRVAEVDARQRAAASGSSAYERWLARSYALRRDPSVIAYYTFDNAVEAPDRLLNRSAAGAALDGKLGGDDASARPTWATGRWPGKGALGFAPDTHQRVVVPSGVGDPLDFSRGPETARPFTVLAWIRPDRRQSPTAAILAKGIGVVEQFVMEFDYGGTEESLAFRAFTRNEPYTVPPRLKQARAMLPIQDGWRCIAVTYDPVGASLTLYVDGELADRNDAAAQQLMQMNEPVTIGCRRENQDGSRVVGYFPSFSGHIDELAILGRVVPAEEVRAMFKSGKPD